MESTARKLESYSYADYKTWTDEERFELIEGFYYMMSPAPSTLHQRIVFKLSNIIGRQLNGKKCTPFVSPVDVLLDYKTISDRSKTVVQPDVLVVCDKSKIDERGIFGVPDLVIEVVSPSSIDYDMNTKREIYQKFMVPEYWVIFPADKTVIVYTLEEEKYTHKNYIKEGTIVSSAVESISAELSEIFEEI